MGVGRHFDRGEVVVTLDATGKMLSENETKLCSELDPSQFGYERQYFRSQLVDGTVRIYRRLYYGKHAEDGRYWERQLYTVDVATGDTRRR